MRQRTFYSVAAILTVFILFSLFAFFPYSEKAYGFSEATDGDSSRRVLVLMYHSVLKSKTGCYTVSPEKLRSDCEWLSAHGYEPVTLSEIYDFVSNGGELPSKPVVMTFDDSYYNHYYYAYPIFKELNFCGVINVIGCFSEYSSTSGDSDNPNYSHLTWGEIKELKESGIFEIGNHSYNMHKFKGRYGISRNANESSEEYRAALVSDAYRLERKLITECGFRTNIYAYPFGKYSDEAERILSDEGYKIMLTCYEKYNVFSRGDTEGLKRIFRFNRTGTMGTEEFFLKIGA